MTRPIIVRAGARELPQFEQVLVTRLLETGDMRTAIKRRLTEDSFFLPDTRAAYTFLVGYYKQYGSTPSRELFLEEFPEFDFHTTSDSVEAICDHLRTNKLYRDLQEMTEEGVRLTRESPAEALNHYRATLAALSAQYILTRDYDLTKTVKESLAEYDRVKAGHGLLGIPWPWAKLTDTTLGIQNEELIFIYARPKSLKTWLMISTAVACHQAGRRPLFITLEMPTDQIRRRTVAVFSRVDYMALRAGKLTPAEERHYREDLEAFAEMPPFILSGGDENAGTGVSALAAKVQEYNPDIIFVDGVYLMRDDRSAKRTSDWSSMANITRDLKQLAKRLCIPIVGSTQSNRSGERTKGTSLSEMAYSDSFAQDADYVIRVIYDKKEKDNNEAIITLPGIREAPGCTFTVNAFVAKDLSQKFVCTEQGEVDEILAGTDEAGVIR